MRRAVPYQEKYHKQVIDLLGLLWVNWSYELRDRVFRWKYLENPYCQEPQFFLMLDEDKVVAVRGFFVYAYLMNGDTVYAGIPADSVTHPGYRRQGLFEQLTRSAMDYNAAKGFPNFYLPLSSNSMAASGHLKAGFSLLGRWTEFHKFSPVGFCCGVFKKDLTAISCISGDYEIRISDVLEPGEAVSVFKNDYVKGIHLLKNESFFSWRYRQPAFSYVFLEVKHENQLLAWASFSLISKGRALMTDFHFSNKEAFYAGLECLSRQMGIWVIQTRVFINFGKTLDGLKGLGFKGFRNLMKWIGKGPAEPILVKAAINGGAKTSIINEAYLSDPLNWDLHLIDSDGA